MSALRVFLAIFVSSFVTTAYAATSAAGITSDPNLYGKLGVVAVVAMILSNIMFTVAIRMQSDNDNDYVAVHGSALAAAIAAAAFTISAATVATTVTTALIAIAATVVAIVVAFLSIFGDVKAYTVVGAIFYVIMCLGAVAVYFGV